MSLTWQKEHTKSVIADATIMVTGSNYDHDVPITIHVKALELDYGPAIYFEVSSSIPYTDTHNWSDHPFMCSMGYMDDGKVGNVVEDTPAIRAMIAELVSGQKKMLYTSTDCTHKARLIKAIASFWS